MYTGVKSYNVFCIIIKYILTKSKLYGYIPIILLSIYTSIFSIIDK